MSNLSDFPEFPSRVGQVNGHTHTYMCVYIYIYMYRYTDLRMVRLRAGRVHILAVLALLKIWVFVGFPLFLGSFKTLVSYLGDLLAVA